MTDMPREEFDRLFDEGAEADVVFATNLQVLRTGPLYTVTETNHGGAAACASWFAGFGPRISESSGPLVAV